MTRLGLVVCLALGCTAQGPGAAANEPAWQASGKGGAVAAGSAEAVKAALVVLEKGGNAVDAAVAAILVMTVTDYGLFCMGGECPMLVYDAKTARVKVLAGQGAAPELATPEYFKAHGGIPLADAPGNLAAATVPAVVDLCVTALKAFGTRTFSDSAAPALELLKAGRQDWHPNLARTLWRLMEAEAGKAGDRLAGLQAVADRFYRGDIAADLDAWYRDHGGLLRKKDLAAHVTRIEDPVTAPYRGFTVCKCDTWTQGAFLLQTLRLLEGRDLKAMGRGAPDYVHTVVEYMKLALADRDRYYADPLFEKVPLRELLADGYTELRRALLEPRKASHALRPGDPWRPAALAEPGAAPAPRGGKPNDTTTCVVADRFGNVVAATPSGWGSTAGTGGVTGVAHSVRLISANTIAGHPNCVQPGKRPRTTLTPTLVLKDGKPVLAISVAGGDRQDQASLQVLLDFIEFGLKPADAVSGPRFATRHHVDSFTQQPPLLGSLELDSRHPASLGAELSGRNHDVTIVPKPRDAPVMLYVDREAGLFYAAGDPATRRHAGALKN